jgi:DnaJ-class molecular chaperone
MPEIDDLRHAYHILAAPLSSSAAEIRLHYVEMVKRWHPDRYCVGTPEHGEASQMTRSINEAYTKIEDAPLRHYVDKPSAFTIGAPEGSHASENSSSDHKLNPTADPFPNADRVNFWVRFMFGALLGGFFSLALLFNRNSPFMYTPVRTYLGITAVMMLVGGVLSGYGSDEFWISMFSDSDSKWWWRWWRWWRW